MTDLRQLNIRAQYGVTLGSLLILLVITALNTNPPIFDVILFVRNMTLFEKYGLSSTFLLEMYDQAPGPLFQIVQTIFKPVTHMETPGIRLVNVFLFFGVIGCTYAVLRSWLGKEIPAALWALNLAAVPVVWQVAGMALTEMPAMFMVMVALMILARLLSRGTAVNVPSAALALAGGIALGLAIVGRTPYLMILPAIVVLAYNPLAKSGNRCAMPLTLFAIYFVTAAAIPLPMFLIWKGLLPPAQAVIAAGGLKLWHGVLAFAYAGIITLLLVPRWFRMNKLIAVGLAVLLVVFVVLNIYWWQVAYWPFYFALASILPENIVHVYTQLVSPALMVFSAYFVFNLVVHVFERRHDSFYLAVAAMLVFILLTCVNIKHQFSSRYVAQASPFLMILLAGKDDLKDYKIWRLLVGAVIGYFSLQTYLHP